MEKNPHKLIKNQLFKHADVAEWLRRLTRNQFLSRSIGSNPIICG